MERDYYLLVFDSTHAAMAAERSLLPRLPLRLMPTLRQITASCGVSLRVEAEDYPALAAALSENIVCPETCRLFHIVGPQATEVSRERQCGT